MCKFTSPATMIRIERIRKELLARDMTSAEIAGAVHISPAYAREYIRHLRETFQIHIVGYQKLKRAHIWHLPIYAWGAGADAPPPRRQTNAERARIRRKDPEKKLQDAMRLKARKIFPHRDWTAAWIPTRSAA